MKKLRQHLLLVIIALIALFVISGCSTAQPGAATAVSKEANFRGGGVEFAYSESKWQVSQTPRSYEGNLITLYNQDNEALITLVAYERINARESDLFRMVREREEDLEISNELTGQEMVADAKVYSMSYQVDENGETRYTYSRINRYSNAWNIAVLAEYKNEQDLAGIQEILSSLNISKTKKLNDIAETQESESRLGAVLDTYLYSKNGEKERRLEEAYAKADKTFRLESGYEYIYNVEMVSPLGNTHKILTLENSYYSDYEGDYASSYDYGLSYISYIDTDEEHAEGTAADFIEAMVTSDKELYESYGDEYQNIVIQPLQKSGDAAWQVLQYDEESWSTGEMETSTLIYYAKQLSDTEFYAWELEMVPYGYSTTTNEVLAEMSKAFDISIEKYGPTEDMLDPRNQPATYADYGYEYDGEGEIVEEVDGYTYIGKTKLSEYGQEAEVYIPRGYYTSNWEYMAGFDLYGVDGYAYLDYDYYGTSFGEYAYSEALSNAEYHKGYSSYYANISDVELKVNEDKKIAVAYFTEDYIGYDDISYPTWQIFICQELSDGYFMIYELELNSNYFSKETNLVLKEYGELLGVDFSFFSAAAASDGEEVPAAETDAAASEGETDSDEPDLSGADSEEI